MQLRQEKAAPSICARLVQIKRPEPKPKNLYLNVKCLLIKV